MRLVSRSTHVSFCRLQPCSLGGFARGNIRPYVTDEQNMLRNLANALLGGVEKRRSDGSLPVAIGEVFTAPPQSGLALFCFLFPLIALDVRISRIQRSERAHGFAHGRLAVRSMRLTRPSA